MTWEACEERTDRDNFTHSIYEPGYKGTLVARVNQNGQYPEHVEMILKAAAGKREAAPIIEQQLARMSALEAMLRECLWYVGEYESENESNRALSVITRANELLRKE